jgi:tRNA pseudouridine55 synthase
MLNWSHVETRNGVLVVDKPAGWTSHDVVNKARRLVGTRKIGHLGTLDPMATGVLPLLIERATRLAQFFGRADKVYEGTIEFGYATSTYDAEGRPVSEPVAVSLDAERIEALLAPFAGRMMQTPPAVSAKKIQGTPAYKLARKNIEVKLEPVEIEIHSLTLLRWEGSEIDIRVHCSAGTYLRSIAHDLGQALGTGAFLKRLRRTASGGFDLSMARTVEELVQLSAEGRLVEAIVPAADLLPEFPSEYVDAATAAGIRQGRDFRLSPFRVSAASFPASKYVKALSSDGDLLAIGEAKLPNVYHPVLVL